VAIAQASDVPRIRAFWRSDDSAQYTGYVVELGDVVNEVGAFDRGLRHREVFGGCLTGSDHSAAETMDGGRSGGPVVPAPRRAPPPLRVDRTR
jgi:hypothetical protein